MAGFTAIAAGIGIATTIGTTALSFSEMAKQNDLAAKAGEDAAKAMDEAKKQLSINPFAAISLPTQAYDMQTNTILAEGAQATQAGVESERGVAATAGRIAAATNEAGTQIQAKQSQDLYALQTQTAQAERDINKSLAGVNMAEAEGAQKAAAQAQNAANQYQTQGVQGVANTIGQALKLAPLYGSTAASRQYGNFGDKYNSMIKNNQVPSSLMDASGKPLSAEAAFAKVSGITTTDLGKFTTPNQPINPYAMQGYATKTFTPEQLKGFSGQLSTLGQADNNWMNVFDPNYQQVQSK
jgi:hypothetical protein